MLTSIKTIFSQMSVSALMGNRKGSNWNRDVRGALGMGIAGGQQLQVEGTHMPRL